MAVDYGSDVAGGATTGAMVGGPWGAAAGAGLGLIKGLTIDADKERRDKALQAATARYSPWTGLKPQAVKYADPLGQTMQFGATGLALGQNMQNAQTDQQLKKAQMDWMNRGGSPGAAGVGAATLPAPAVSPSPWRLGDYNFSTNSLG